MNIHINIPAFWKRPFPEHPHLPTHLPRLLLAEKYEPHFVRQCPVTQSLTPLLSLLDWEQLPTTLSNKRTGWHTIHYPLFTWFEFCDTFWRLATFCLNRGGASP